LIWHFLPPLEIPAFSIHSWLVGFCRSEPIVWLDFDGDRLIALRRESFLHRVNYIRKLDDQDEKTVPMGSYNFTVKEIEVFEIRDETALPTPALLPRKSRFARNSRTVASHLFHNTPRKGD
jgi:exonuclease III